jgi:hypothetical protein
MSMPDIVVQKIMEQALRQGYTRGADPILEISDVLDEEAYNTNLVDMAVIDGRECEPIELAHHEDTVDDNEIAPPVEVNVAAQAQAADVTDAGVPLGPEPPIAPASSRALRAFRRDESFIKPLVAAAPEILCIRHISQEMSGLNQPPYGYVRVDGYDK